MPVFLLTWITGAAGKYIAAVFAAVAIIGGYLFWLREHDGRLLAEQAAREAAVVAADRVKQAEAGAAAVQAEATAQIARITATSRTRQEIARAPVTFACAASPAVAAALRGLRPDPAPGPGAPGSAPVAAGVPAAAHPPGPAPR